MSTKEQPKSINTASEAGVAGDTKETEHEVQEEIEWGLVFRRNRIQEKQFERVNKEIGSASSKKRLIRRRRTGREKRCVCEEDLTVAPIQVKKIPCRNALTRQQHIALLAQPKQVKVYQFNIETYMRSKGLKICPPRFLQLALPKKDRLLGTWQEHEYHLEPEFIIRMKELLAKEEGLDPVEADRYFDRLDAHKKRKLRRLRRQRQRLICQRKQKKSQVSKDVDKLASAVINYFVNKKPLSDIKYRHMMLSDHIIDKLQNFKLLKCGYKRGSRDEYSKILYIAMDQLAVWLESVIDDVDDESEGSTLAAEDMTVTPSTFSSSTLSGLMSTISELSEKPLSLEVVEYEEEYEEVYQVYEEASEEESYKELVYLEALEEDLVSPGYGYGEDMTLDEMRAFDEEELTEDEQEFEDALSALAEGEAGMEEGDVGDGTKAEGEELSDSATLAGIPPIEEPTDGTESTAPTVSGGAAGKPSEEPRECGDTNEEFMVEEYELDESAYLAEADSEMMETVSSGEIEQLPADMEGKDDLYKEQRDLLEEIIDRITEGIEGDVLIPLKLSIGSVEIPHTRKPSHVEEHAPDMICCVTLKTWATWLLDVAKNSHGWCKWIQEVIGQIRLYASILRGEVKNQDGTVRILYKEEWDKFKDNLEKDIISWRQYNMHVKDLSDGIIEGFQGKRVACCPTCLQSRMIINEEAAHQVQEQLIEAMKTSGYWRRWLDEIVVKAQELTALQKNLPTAPGPVDVPTPSKPYDMFDIVEIQSPGSPSAGSSESVFIIEEL